MANFRGLEGFLALGGVLTGAGAPPKLNGALTIGNTTMNIDGNGSALNGVVVVGDTFTIAGEAGTPTHTVTGTVFRIAVANAIAGITFTPGIAAGGAADNAVVTSVAEAKAHNINASVEVLDTTSFGLRWRTVKGGMASWTGQASCWLDKGDPEQSGLIDLIVATTPGLTVNGVLFGTNVGKQWYAGCVLSGFSVTVDKGAIIEATFNFEGSGPVLPNWI